MFYSIQKGKCKVELQAPSMGFSVSCLFDSILSILPRPSAFSHISSQLKGPHRSHQSLSISSTLSHHHRSQSVGKWQVCRISEVQKRMAGRQATAPHPLEACLLLSSGYFTFVTLFSSPEFCQRLFTPSQRPSFLLPRENISQEQVFAQLPATYPVDNLSR